MLDDLDSIHHTLFETYESILLLSGTNLRDVPVQSLPARHLPM